MVLPKKLGPLPLSLLEFENSEKSTPELWRIHGDLINDGEFWPLKLLKLKYRKRDQAIQLFYRIGCPQVIRSPLFNLLKFEKSEKSTPESCRKLWNLMNNEKFGSLKLLKLKYRRGDQIIQSFCRISSSKEIRSPLFNLWKFEKSEKSAPGTCRMHWNLIIDKKFGSWKLLKLKYRRADHYNSAVLENRRFSGCAMHDG